MARTFNVIYEKGVFRPLAEVKDLAEGTQAVVMVPTEDGEFLCEYKTWQEELQEDGWDIYD
jgi:predicted DNA-binding antitoxin AbrB/MazE fold protein